MGFTFDPALRAPKGRRAFRRSASLERNALFGALSALEREPGPRHVEVLLLGEPGHPSSVSAPVLTTAGASGSLSSALDETAAQLAGALTGSPVAWAFLPRRRMVAAVSSSAPPGLPPAFPPTQGGVLT